MTGEKENELEVVVTHFLGVDHVGHTYGPHNQHMDQKLKQMDAALSTTLDILDESKHCHLALIFGDHGMTEDGNHGGGTEFEINAALFVHFSPECGEMPLDLAPQMGTKYIQDAFQSIHQIDLVPTISVLLGLPIPYGNLGGITPSLLGFKDIKETAAALALNSAQLWRYFTVYSNTANRLPNLPELEEQLDEAIAAFKEALSDPATGDSNLFYKACGLFKVFLVEAAELGHRVWTRFDTFGMSAGGSIVFMSLVIWASSVYYQSGTMPPRTQLVEIFMCFLFVLFQAGLLSFSNSYIEAEQAIVVYMMSMIGLALALRMHGAKAGGNARGTTLFPLLLPLLARISESFVTGHGLDPSIRLHWAHSAVIFIPSLLGLGSLRVYWFRKFAKGQSLASLQLTIDLLTLLLIAIGWLEKRNVDQTRNGYIFIQISVFLLLFSLPLATYQAASRKILDEEKTSNGGLSRRKTTAHTLTILSKLMILVMVVTGPSTGATVFLVSMQGYMLYVLSGATGFYEVSSPRLMCRSCNLRLIAFLCRSQPRFWHSYGGCWFVILSLRQTMDALSIDYNIQLLSLQVASSTLSSEESNYS